jgi:hypothetical protein
MFCLIFGEPYVWVSSFHPCQTFPL